MARSENCSMTPFPTTTNLPSVHRKQRAATRQARTSVRALNAVHQTAGRAHHNVAALAAAQQRDIDVIKRGWKKNWCVRQGIHAGKRRSLKHSCTEAQSTEQASTLASQQLAASDCTHNCRQRRKEKANRGPRSPQRKALVLNRLAAHHRHHSELGVVGQVARFFFNLWGAGKERNTGKNEDRAARWETARSCTAQPTPAT